LNKIYTKYKEYDTYNEVIEDIKTVEINGFGMACRRPAYDQHDQHEYACANLSQPIQMKCLSFLSVTK